MPELPTFIYHNSCMIREESYNDSEPIQVFTIFIYFKKLIFYIIRVLIDKDKNRSLKNQNNYFFPQIR